MRPLSPRALFLPTLLAALAAATAAEAQTRVLVLADGSTRFSAVSYYNAAVSEFATVVGSANVQGRNDLDTVALTPADLRRPTGESYDVIVMVASFNGIGTSNWTLLRDAVRTRAARSFVLFSDHCSICSADNVDGGNGNGLVPLLNAASGWTTAIGMLRTDPLPVPLNTNSPLSTSFVGMNPMQTYDYRSINGIPANNALYLAPGAAIPAAGTTRIADVTAFLLPTSQSYGGLGACVFGIADVNPLAIPGNPGRVGPAFVNAITSPTGSCAAGPLVITGPTNGSTVTIARPPITGLAQPGATVTVTVGAQTLTAIAALDGTWSVTPTALPDGTYTATATRTLGGVTQTASVTFTVVVCGSGAMFGAERCDDGNLTDGDGCSAMCVPERGYVCRGDRSVCRVTCGDGVRAASEACDDGNTNGGDGCSPACAAEEGWACTNPDTSVFYSHRGVTDCVVVPDFEPASSATVPARLAVPGVGVWTSYRARYVGGAVDFSDRPTSFRAPTLLQYDPGTGPRAAVFGGLTRTGQTSPTLARAVAEMASHDFAVGVAGSVRGATPDIPGACDNNSDTLITYRIDSMSACAPVCRDTSPADTDMGCMAMAPHCRPVGERGGRCEVCIDTAMTGVDVGCATATPYCVGAMGGGFRCVACAGAIDCNDGDPCTVDACGADGTCARTAVAPGERGQCPSGLVCSAGPMATCVGCVTSAQCSGATPVCDEATRTCRAGMDAAPDVGVDATMDAAPEAAADVAMEAAADASKDAAADVAMDAAMEAAVDAAPDAAPDAVSPPDAVVAADVASDAVDVVGTMDSGPSLVIYQGGGCGCSAPGRSTRHGAAMLAALAALTVARRRRRVG
jgi:MYXO-CTERM domain-containing protein